jgi:hypothetical protein
LTWKPFSISRETPSSQEEENIFESLHVQKISREIESRRHIQLQEYFKKLEREAEAVFLRGSRVRRQVMVAFFMVNMDLDPMQNIKRRFVNVYFSHLRFTALALDLVLC